MCGSKPLRLDRDLGARRDCLGLGGHCGVTGSHDDDDPSVPASVRECKTWASIDRPASLCKTFGCAERIRKLSPAARTMARQVRS